MTFRIRTTTIIKVICYILNRMYLVNRYEQGRLAHLNLSTTTSLIDVKFVRRDRVYTPSMI